MLEINLKDVYNGIESNNFPITIVSHSPSVMQNLSVQLGISNQEAFAKENFWLDEERKQMNFYLQAKLYIIENSYKNFHFSNPTAIIQIALEMLEDVKQKK